MSNPTTWESGSFDRDANERFFSLRRAFAFVLLIFLLTVGGGIWVYLEKVEALAAGDSMAAIARAKHLDGWFLQFTVVATISGTVLLLTAMRELGDWRNSWRSFFAANDEEWRKAAALLENRIAQSKCSEERLEGRLEETEERAGELARANAVLQEELDKRKLSEMVLNQQRQELVRSKDVLEMHVQARTQELRKLQRRYELILNSAGEGICGLDIEGKATFINPAAAKITGWEVAELIGRSEREIFGPADGKHSERGGIDSRERLLRRRNGTTFLAELIKTPIHEEGREVGAVLVFKDITERKQSEEALARKAQELERSNAELEQFAFVASHDLQEPLRKIQAFGDRLKIKCQSIELGEAADYLERMQNAAARMQTLINDLLAFSRVIRSSQPLVPVDLAVLTREVLGDLEVRIEKTGARIEVSELPTIDADPMQMRQLLQNLISNALKFQPAGAQPVVKVQARILRSEPLPAGDRGAGKRGAAGASSVPLCELSVQDNGIGFDEKYTDKIFAVFQRLHGRSEYEGTGIGLAVCRRIVDRHGGSIAARSRPGAGATFVITLPARQIAERKGA